MITTQRGRIVKPISRYGFNDIKIVVYSLEGKTYIIEANEDDEIGFICEKISYAITKSNIWSRYRLIYKNKCINFSKTILKTVKELGIKKDDNMFLTLNMGSRFPNSEESICWSYNKWQYHKLEKNYL